MDVRLLFHLLVQRALAMTSVLKVLAAVRRTANASAGRTLADVTARDVQTGTTGIPSAIVSTITINQS